MTTKFALFAAAVSFAALPSMAFAADAIDEIPQAPEAPAYEQPVSTGWSGAYAGIYGGYGKGDHGGVDTNGFKGGAYGGYNMQSGQFVYGGEADVGYSGSDGQAGPTVVKNGFNGALRARAGIDLDPVLVYGAGGVAATNGKIANGVDDDTATHIGWTAGAGIEGKITQNVIGRAEYRHNNYGRENYDVGGGTDAKLTENEIRIGAGLKF